MDATPNLSLPFIVAAQAQKHVTHNEAIRALDALVQLAVFDRDLGVPPASPADGARYIVPAGASGAWAGQTGKVAAWQDGAWAIYAAREGWLAWVADENSLYAFDGAAWVPAGAGGGGPFTTLGVNATPDTTNRLTVSAPATLLSHEGAGHQLKINKAAAAGTASLLFQDAFSGRAEIGLAGDDDLRCKVSADGTTWRDAVVIDRTTGAVAMPYTTLAAAARPSLLVNGDFQINQRAFAGGALVAGAYGHDRWKAATGGASYTVSGYVVTLASGTLVQPVECALWAVASLASTQVTVSVEAPSADLTVTFGSASGAITAGSGRRAVTLSTAAGDTGNLELKIARATAGSVAFGRVKLELGPQATAWQPRPLPDELGLCRRYFEKSYDLAVAPGTVTNAGRKSQAAVSTTDFSDAGDTPFATMKRVAPTVTVYSPGTGTAGRFRNLDTSLDVVGSGLSASQAKTLFYSPTAAMTTGVFHDWHWVAEAEL